MAFARYYVALVNHAQATGETSMLQAIETSSSESCARSRKTVEELYASGAKLVGGDWAISSVQAIKNPATKGWLVELVVRFGPQKIDRPGADADQQLKGGTLPINLQAIWRGGWRLSECTRGA